MNDRAKHESTRRLAHRLLDYENIATTPTTGDGTPDLDTPAAWISTSAQTLARVGHSLAQAQQKAREASDDRPVVLVNRYERKGTSADALAVLSVHDLARLLTAHADAQEVAT
ncbi:hypothetical protein [Microbacterium sp. 16-032]|uniref:hypothetical protein n=1 Tax=Microbacterium sp. 16-032 TaxID=3239808 RepID=UPI0034E295FD